MRRHGDLANHGEESVFSDNQLHTDFPCLLAVSGYMVLIQDLIALFNMLFAAVVNNFRTA